MDGILFEDINPFVRYAQFLTVTSNGQYSNIASYDYRLFFCSGGSGEIVVDEVNYAMKIGSVIMWSPGIKYSLLINKTDPYLELMGVNFDFTQNHRDLDTPIAPEKWRSFDSEKIVETVRFENCPKFNFPVYIPNIPFIHNPLYNTISEHISKKDFHTVRTSGHFKSILAMIARFSVNEKSASKSEFLVDKIIQYLHSHYREELNNKLLGEYFGYHPNHLNRLILKHTGMPIHKYLISCRINAAIELIQASDLKISEIAQTVGFKDSTHFLKYFKQFTGKTTKDFRR